MVTHYKERSKPQVIILNKAVVILTQYDIQEGCFASTGYVKKIQSVHGKGVCGIDVKYN